jgi:hypothetical protein
MSQKKELAKNELKKLKRIKRIKKKIKYNLQIFLLFSAVIMIWWAIWGFFDMIFPYTSDYRMI